MSDLRLQPVEIKIDELFDGRYQLLEVIGTGGFGTVYKAWQPQLERHVAVKMLNGADLDVENVKRFEREAKALNVLNHINITRFYAFGIADGAPYMVTEFAPGETLREKLLKRKLLHPKRAMKLMIQVLSGLKCAHDQGIVHRDLKPANIIMMHNEDRSDLIKIIDFGLAKLLPSFEGTFATLTETGMTVGTCHYMAPEQCQGIKVDGRADIYSVGCILYECLTGTMPYNARESLAVMYQHLNEQAKPLSEYRNLYQSEAERDALQNFIDNCMAKDRDKRYQSAEEALTELKSLLEQNLAAVRASYKRSPAAPLKPTQSKPEGAHSILRNHLKPSLFALPGSAELKKMSSRALVGTAFAVLSIGFLIGHTTFMLWQNDQSRAQWRAKLLAPPPQPQPQQANKVIRMADLLAPERSDNEAEMQHLLDSPARGLSKPSRESPPDLSGLSLASNSVPADREKKRLRSQSH